MTKNKYNKSDLYIRVIRIIAGFVKSLIKILTKIRSNFRANERRGSSLTIPKYRANERRAEFAPAIPSAADIQRS